MLPKIDTPVYDTTLALSGETVKYRPFLVKEEKILMLASEGDDYKEMVQAWAQVVDNCTCEKLNVENMPMFQLQDLFVKIRMASVGESQDFNLVCGNCQGTINYTLDLNEMGVGDLSGVADREIKVNDEFMIKMKFPSAVKVTQEEGQTDIDTIIHCIESIVTEEEEQFIEDVKREEVDEFINDLPIDVFEKMREFIRSMPVLQKLIEYECPHCGEDQAVNINGYEHFFA